MVSTLPRLAKENNSCLSLSWTVYFTELLERFTEYLQSEKIYVTPYTPKSLEKFEQLSPQKKAEVVTSFSDYYQLCSDFVAMGGQLKHSRTLLKFLFSQLKITAPDDLFDKVEDEDVVEIYRTDFTQYFRNLKFLEVCSYALMELYVSDWPSLYSRPQSITDKIVQSATNVMRNPADQTLPFDVPDHYLEEVYSEKRNFFHIKQKYIAPVYREEGGLLGVIATLEAKLIGSKKETNINVTPLSH